MGDNFNRDFSRALRNKLSLQDSQIRQNDSSAYLQNEQAGVVGANSRSAINLEGSTARLNRERTGLLGREVESTAAYRDQLARSSRIGTNIDLGEGIEAQNPSFFESAYKNLERGGANGVAAFSATAPGQTSPAAIDFSPSAQGDLLRSGPSFNRADYASTGVSDELKARRKVNQGVIGRLPGLGTQYRAEGGVIDALGGLSYADGGEVGVPEELNFAGGGIVPGGVDASLTADYQLYRQAADNAGVPALPIQEAIPRMAQIRANKRQSVLDMIAQGGTVPQGFADGGEISGPGTGKSDSIPAVVDGVAPAAVSDGEFRIPKHVVDYFGTKLFDGLVEKARMAGKVIQRKQGAVANATA